MNGESESSANSAILITSANASFFDFVQATILSLREHMPAGKGVSVGFLDCGCTPDQLAWIHRHVDFVRKPRQHFTSAATAQCPDFLKGLLARPFLREYFPGFDIYFWIDADAWVNNWSGVELMLRGASRERLAIVPEIDRGHRTQYGGMPGLWSFLHTHYEACYGKEVANDLRSFPALNAGVFAMHHRAPHWEPWAACLADALQRSVSLMTDQIALNLVVYRHCFDQTEMLPAWCNWTCHQGLPAWDKANRRLVEPYLPHTPIGILHLTGRGKPISATLKTTEAEEVQVRVRYPAREEEPPPSPAVADHDYVSPGLVRISPASCFPNRVIGNKHECPWPYLRREIPHHWWVDRRSPQTGLLNPDEAHILYNLALQFSGKRALEIGCWVGWSACHLALAGVQLDVIDPLLADSKFYTTVCDSLSAAGVLNRVNLVPGASPRAVHDLATQKNRKWTLFFIDGNHDQPAPREDAVACAAYAEEDAAILFHDLAAPAVMQGLQYLANQGWHTTIFQTMQIMGIAYRGEIVPPHHVPDENLKRVSDTI